MRRSSQQTDMEHSVLREGMHSLHRPLLTTKISYHQKELLRVHVLHAWCDKEKVHTVHLMFLQQNI